jgi:phosphate transport system substrate-binding protein
MRRLWILKLVGIFLAINTVGISAEEGQSEGQINYIGCSVSKIAFMQDIAKAYEAKTGIKVNVGGGGVTVGIKSVILGKVDIGGSCRHGFKEEVAQGVVFTQVGGDALVVFVHPSNPIDNLTPEQVLGIFTGKITDWSEVGGSQQKILPVGRDDLTSGVERMAREIIFKDLLIRFSKDAIARLSSSEIEQEVEENPLGIGMSGISSAKTRKLKILKINDVYPSKENIINMSYPYSRPLYLCTKGKPTGKNKDFIDFVLSEEGQIIVGKNALNLKEFESITKPGMIAYPGTLNATHTHLIGEYKDRLDRYFPESKIEE